MYQRILQWLNYKGFKNLNHLAKYLGYSSAEKLYRLQRSPDAKPSFEIIEDLSRAFETLNLNWLISGVGQMENTNQKEYLAPEAGHAIVNETKENLHTAQGLKPQIASANASPTASPSLNFGVPNVVTVDSSNRENIVLVNQKARAGYLNGFGDVEYVKTLPTFYLPQLKAGTYRAFEVDGESMEPTLENKEIVIGSWVESLADIREDRVHILVTKSHGIVIKRLLNAVSKYGYIVAKSDAFNSRNQYKNLLIDPEDIQEIWYARMHLNANFRSPSEVYHRLNTFEADLEEIKRRLGV
ncbi:S24 family peptidase [Nubsella zeaxanthinifaciens]|uniref:S24 family peptidase n=1 Tax=Nubsella zeaxanthinifaciens TaxID=392412 RepID=UPI000DE50E32|nr:S24 family peptidase [Nubsella zeaxanthinifaciens]